jgi:hypothetical protein
MKGKLKEVQWKCKKLECDLKESSEKERRLVVQYRSKIQLLENKITEAEHCNDPLS